MIGNKGSAHAISNTSATGYLGHVQIAVRAQNVFQGSFVLNLIKAMRTVSIPVRAFAEEYHDV